MVDTRYHYDGDGSTTVGMAPLCSAAQQSRLSDCVLLLLLMLKLAMHSAPSTSLAATAG